MPKQKNIWCYRDTNKKGAACRSCHKITNCKPAPDCISIEHKAAYERRLIRDHEKSKDPIWHAHRLIQSRETAERLRTKIILHYGDRCTCCGFNDLTKKIHGKRYLQIDKISGGHNRLAREGKIPMGNSFFKWLKKNNYPPGFRILCVPCNASMEPNGIICELHKWQSHQFDNILNDLYQME